MSTLYDLISGDGSLQDYWPLDGAATDHSVDTAGGNGVFHGAPTYDSAASVDGRGGVTLNTASDSAGVGDYFASQNAYSIGDTGSIEVWFKPPATSTGITTPAALHLLAGYVGGDPDAGDTQFGPSISTRLVAGGWQVVIYMPIASAGLIIESSVAVPGHLAAGSFSQIALTWGPSLATAYINGVQAATLNPADWFADGDTFAEYNFTTAGFNVGGGFAGGSPSHSSLGMLGSFSNVATFTGTLSSGTVLSHYVAGATSAPAMRVTQLYAETLQPDVSTGTMRVTQVYAEALCSDRDAINYAVSATTHAYISEDASCFVLGRKRKSAGDNLSFGFVASAIVVGAKPVAAATALGMRSVGSKLMIGGQLVSAATAMSLSVYCDQSGIHDVSATTAVYLGSYSAGYKSPILLSASTVFSLSAAATSFGIGAKVVYATTSLGISGRASKHNSAVYRVSAATGIAMSSVATKKLLAIYHVSASSGIRLSHRSASVADRVVAAASSFLAWPSSKQNRDLSVSAVTAMGVTPSPASNRFLDVAASTAVYIVSSASSVITGTLAASGIVFVDRADAVVWFPWRRDSLSLVPGGNLPHS